MKSLFSFLDKFPTANRLMNIGISIIVLIILLSAIALATLISMSSSAKKEANRRVSTPVPTHSANNTRPKEVFPVADVLESQLKAKENDLKNSRSENDELKKSIKAFADTVDKNFLTLQSQIKSLDGRLNDVEVNINSNAADKNTLKIIRLDKKPYVSPPPAKTPTPKKGKVLAQVGNVVWVDSSQKK
ncbi:hypothetical protein [Citrobacter freundii]|uniref:hypothetical protein n=1 Tax=Citrobacter freundii TaxID=546 RepID=UPI0019082748|nr:hypothetical protein [Citrobacter freundii]MBJ8931597.1 hypothetical protein [Citrobacter freundii]